MKFAIIGAGNMGGALARGLAKGTLVHTADLIVSDPSNERTEALRREFPEIRIAASNKSAVREADVVLFAVKPWLLEGVIQEVKEKMDYDRQVVISIAGGIGTKQICQYLDRGDADYPAVYYLIPNTAVDAMAGMTFMTSVFSTAETDAQLLAIFKELGDAMLVEERLMNAGMALSSCGIAYVMRYVRAAMEGGVELGFYPKDAQRIIMQTMKGAVELLEKGGAHPEAEIDKVTTPGGLTIRGLNAMEEAGFTQSVIKGLRASMKP